MPVDEVTALFEELTAQREESKRNAEFWYHQCRTVTRESRARDEANTQKISVLTERVEWLRRDQDHASRFFIVGVGVAFILGLLIALAIRLVL